MRHLSRRELVAEGDDPRSARRVVPAGLAERSEAFSDLHKSTRGLLCEVIHATTELSTAALARIEEAISDARRSRYERQARSVITSSRLGKGSSMRWR